MHQIPPCADVGPALPARVHHPTSPTLKMHMLARSRNSNRDQSDDAPALGQRCPADHHPTSRTLRMNTLGQCWLNVDIPNAIKLTMRGRWANVARPSITRRRPHSNAYMLAQRRNSDHDQSDHGAPTLGQGCPVDHHPTSRTLKMPTLIR